MACWISCFHLKEKAPIQFDLIAVNLDQKQPGFPERVLPDYLQALGVPFRIVEQDTYSVVKRVVPEGKTMCALCSRLRRGALYRIAGELGATKIALGHHRDDVLATFFLNLFHAGTLKAMPAKLLSDDGKHIVIRPLAYVAEDDLAAYAEAKAFPDHSVHAVRLAGEPAAQGGRPDAESMGEVRARAHLVHPARADRRAALATAGSKTV